MATDDYVNELEPTTTITVESEPEQPVTYDKLPTISEDKINELINAKFEEISKIHSKEIDELKSQIFDKDKEIESLKRINQNIILTTNVEQKPKEITDFSSVDFDEVDWDDQASKYMAKIDEKIFS